MLIYTYNIAPNAGSTLQDSYSALMANELVWDRVLVITNLFSDLEKRDSLTRGCEAPIKNIIHLVEATLRCLRVTVEWLEHYKADLK